MSLGPLTTTYVPPPSCTTSFLTDFKPMGAWDVMGPLETTGDCFPPDYEDDARKYYSPGICPAGYTAACADPAPGLGGGQTSVTTVTCCPIGFTCISEPYTLIAGSTFICNSWILDFTGTQIILSSGSPRGTRIGTISAPQTAIANAFGIQIQYRYDDFISQTSTVVSTHSSISSQASSSIFSSTSSSISSSTSPIMPPMDMEPDEKKPQSGLSIAAALGIGLGAGFSGILLIGGSVWVICVRRYRARRLLNRPTGNVAQINSVNMEQPLWKPPTIGLQELPVEGRRIPELDGNRQ